MLINRAPSTLSPISRTQIRSTDIKEITNETARRVLIREDAVNDLQDPCGIQTLIDSQRQWKSRRPELSRRVPYTGTRRSIRVNTVQVTDAAILPIPFGPASSKPRHPYLRTTGDSRKRGRGPATLEGAAAGQIFASPSASTLYRAVDTSASGHFYRQYCLGVKGEAQIRLPSPLGRPTTPV